MKSFSIKNFSYTINSADKMILKVLSELFEKIKKNSGGRIVVDKFTSFNPESEKIRIAEVNWINSNRSEFSVAWLFLKDHKLLIRVAYDFGSCDESIEKLFTGKRKIGSSAYNYANLLSKEEFPGKSTIYREKYREALWDLKKLKSVIDAFDKCIAREPKNETLNWSDTSKNNMKSFSIKSHRTFSEKSSTDKYKKVRNTPYWKEAERLVKIKSPEISQEDCDLIVGFGLDLAAEPEHFIDALKKDLKQNGKKFSEPKNFSKITTEDEFREYAHNVMKNAHGDEYSEEVTNKVVDDLIKDNPDADYGELIGRLTSGFGDKSFADTNVGTVTIKTSNPKKLGELIQMIKDHGNVGHSFECIIDKDDENEESWSWDGDGSDRIDDIEIEDIVRESRTFSIAEDREFAHGRGYKARQLEVKRLQDLYNDVKSKQKGDDPSQKLRNRMLLQEIKVQLEEARYDFYKHAYEESKL